MKHPYEHLLQPLQVGPLTFKNRMISSPTSLPELGVNGKLTPLNIAYYEQRAKGGCACVTVGESIVEIATGRSHPLQIPLDDPDVCTGLTQLADAIHAHGAFASIELSHGGSLCEPALIGGRNAMGASTYTDGFGDLIVGMTEEDIEHITEKFAQAALLVKRCGFDMCMVHGGHGWLLHQFLSPLTNSRTDRFGGSLENRMRFSMMVIDRIRRYCGRNFPIEFRMSGDERTEGGYGLDEGVRIAEMLDGKVDLIHCSAGTQEVPYSAILMHPSIFQKPGENLYIAEEIKKHVKTPVVTVGAFSDPDLMERTIAEGKADLIAMGRALIADPYLPAKVTHNEVDQITPCLRCHECMGSMMATRTIRCTVNPIIGRETTEMRRMPARTRKKVLIAGGGPSGMAAAMFAARRGHEAILCEESGKLGGALTFADGVDFKANIIKYKEYLLRQLDQLGVDIRLNTKVDRALVEEIAPDALFCAVGGDAVVPPIPGADGPNVIVGKDMTPDTPVGDRVVMIGGGLIGCETGVHLANDGHKVTIVEMLPEPAMDCGHFHRIALLEELKKTDVRVKHRCTRITGEGVFAEDESGAEVFFPADTVIMAAGMRARSEEVERLRCVLPDFVLIGSAIKAGNILNAVRSAYDAVMDLG